MLAITRGEGYSVPAQSRALIVRVRPDPGRACRGSSSSLAATAIALGLMLFLKRTMPGKAIRAVTQDRQAARLMGINVERTFMLTFGIGTALAGVAGALLAPIYTLSPHIGGNFILAAFAVVVLGGLGSVPGAYIGGFIVGLVEGFAGYYIDPALKQAIWFIDLRRRAASCVRPACSARSGAEEVGSRVSRDLTPAHASDATPAMRTRADPAFGPLPWRRIAARSRVSLAALPLRRSRCLRRSVLGQHPRLHVSVRRRWPSPGTSSAASAASSRSGTACSSRSAPTRPRGSISISA